MNKDSKMRRVEDSRLHSLYNSFSEATALYANTAAPFQAKPILIPTGAAPSGAMGAMQINPVAAMQPYQQHVPVMAGNAQMDEAWKRAGAVADAQRQLLQLQYHMSQNAMNIQQHHQQQQQQQQAALNGGFYHSAPVTPTNKVGIVHPVAATLKPTTASAFHSVPTALGSAARTPLSASVASTPRHAPPSLFSPSIPTAQLTPHLLDMSFASPPMIHMRPAYDPHFSFPAAPAMASIPASPAALPAHTLLTPLRPAAHMAYGSPGMLHPALGGMPPPPPQPMYVFRQ